MDMVFIHGQMERNMMDNGSTANSMERPDLLILKEKVNLESGKMEKELNGLKPKVLCYQKAHYLDQMRNHLKDIQNKSHKTIVRISKNQRLLVSI